jgi:hypothetical protein
MSTEKASPPSGDGGGVLERLETLLDAVAFRGVKATQMVNASERTDVLALFKDDVMRVRYALRAALTERAALEKPVAWLGEFSRQGGEVQGKQLFYSEGAAEEWAKGGDDDFVSRVSPLFRHAAPAPRAPGADECSVCGDAACRGVTIFRGKCAECWYSEAMERAGVPMPDRSPATTDARGERE